MATGTSGVAAPGAIMVPTSNARIVSCGSPALLGSTSTQYNGTLIPAGICENEIGMGDSLTACRYALRGLVRRLIDRDDALAESPFGEAVERPFDRPFLRKLDSARVPDVLAHVVADRVDAHAPHSRRRLDQP